MPSNLYVIACECGEKLVVEEQQVGKHGKCGKCGRGVYVAPSEVKPFSEAHEGAESQAANRQIGEDGVPIEWNVGDVLLNLYEVTAVLGEGGMGKVFKVFHRGWKMPLAVKSPKARIMLRKEGVANFEQECETWVNLGLHPHIVSCYYVRRLGGVPRIFAEYVEGGSLWEWIQNGRLYKGGPLKAIGRICDYGIQMAWGLQHAHERGLVHQDVKNANVLIGPEDVAKVTDFGLARARALVEVDPTLLDMGGVTNVGMTRYYCSPEQANREKLTKKTDMWSWAMSMLEAYTVKVIWYRGTDGPEVLKKFLEQQKTNPRILQMPPLFADVMQRCLNPDPEKRPEDMNEIAAVLAQVYRDVLKQDYPRQQPRPTEALADSLNNRALSLVDLSRGPHAEKAWELALKADPHHPETTYNWGLFRWRTGRLADDVLVQRLHEVVKFHPQEWLPLYLLAQVHLEQCEFRLASRILRELIQSFPERPEIEAALRLADANLGSTRRPERVFSGHADSISALTCSRDGRYLMSGSEDNTLKVWDLNSGLCVRTLEGHQNTVTSVHFTSDGAIGMSSAQDRTIKLWDIASGKCLRTLEGHIEPVEDVAFSESGHQALSAGMDGTLRLWEIRDRECVAVLGGHRGGVLSVCMDPSGMVALSGGQDCSVRVWDVQGQRCTHVMEGHTGPITCVRMSEDTRLAVSASEDRTLKVWHPAGGKLVGTLEGHQGQVTSVAVSPDGRFAISCGLDKSVRLWELTTGRCLNTLLIHKLEVNAVCFGHDLKHAYSGGADCSAVEWCMGLIKGHPVAPTMICQAVSSETAQSRGRAFEESIASARDAFSKADALTAAQHIRSARRQPGRRRAPEAMKLWRELYTRLPRISFIGAWERATIDEFGEPIKSIQLTYDGRKALVVSGKNRMTLWDVALAEVIREFEPDTASVESVCFSGDGRWVLTGAWEIKLWDANSGSCIRVFERQPDLVNALSIGPDGKFALSAQARTVRLWETATGRAMGELHGHMGDVNAVAWSPDGRLALTGGEDRKLFIWEVATGKCLATLDGSVQPIRSLQFSLDGMYAVSGGGSIWSRPGEVKFWDVAGGECLHTFEGHTDGVQAVSISGDNRYVLSGGRDRTVRMWSTLTGKQIHTFEGHTDSVEAVAMTSDGRYVITGGKDETMRIWALDWELADHVPAEWDPLAEPILRNFLVNATPYAAQLREDREESERRIKQALTRKGVPTWSEPDLAKLFTALGCAGYGWLRPEGVMTVLQRMADSWRAPSGLPEKAGAEQHTAQALMRRFMGRFSSE